MNSRLHLPAGSTCVQGACSQHHCAVKTSGILLDNQRLYLNRLVGWSQEMVPVHVSALFPNVAHTDCFGYMPKQQNISLVNLDKHTALAMLKLSGKKKKKFPRTEYTCAQLLPSINTTTYKHNRSKTNVRVLVASFQSCTTRNYKVPHQQL